MPIYMFDAYNGIPGFKDDSKDTIDESDVEISTDIYNQYMDQQNTKFLRIKNIGGTTFDDMFEEFIPDQVPSPPSIDDRLSAAESAISALMGV